MEGYLVKLPKSSHILVTRLRTCNNRLPVIIGRYQGVNREERGCSKCDANVVGDEFHVFYVTTKKLLGYMICISQTIINLSQHLSNMFGVCKT